MLKERQNQHKKNISSALGTGRSKPTSQEKSTSRSKSKDHPRSKEIQNKILRRMSFQSPSRKDDSSSNKNFSLLTYMAFKEKTVKHAHKAMSR